VVDLAGKHSDENEHEEEGCYREDQHEDPLHEPSHHVRRLVIDLGHLRIRLLDIDVLQLVHVLDHSLVLLELLLETLGELLHPAHHLKHVFFHFGPLSRLVSLNRIVVDFPAFFGLA